MLMYVWHFRSFKKNQKNTTTYTVPSRKPWPHNRDLNWTVAFVNRFTSSWWQLLNRGILTSNPAVLHHSVCQAVQTGPSACGHSVSRGVSPPTGCTMKGFGPCRSMRPSRTSTLEEETKRSTALTCVIQTSVCSSVRRRPRCSKWEAFNLNTFSVV